MSDSHPPITRRTGRFRALLAGIALLTVAPLLAACEPTPDEDAFYTDPVELSGTGAGQILRSRTSTFTLDPAFNLPAPAVSSWQIVYRSNDALDQPNAVSGTVLVPKTPWIGLGRRPIVGFAVGTRGLGDDCAPSYTLSTGTDYEGLFIANLLSKGFAVMVTDYEGLGMPGGHSYVVGRSEGRALLDGVRAAQQLPGSGLSNANPVGLMGYSQGGGAAGWAAELAGSYAPELTIKGTVAGGVPADLLEVADFADGSAFTALALMAAIGFDNAYPELDLDGHLNAKGRQLLAESDEMCLVSFDGVKTLFKTAFRSRTEWAAVDPLTSPAWTARLNENKLGSTRPKAPVYQFHGIADEMVPYGQAKQLRRDWCDAGANVHWSPVVGEHVSSMVTEHALATTWLQARFNGLPAISNCWLP